MRTTAPAVLALAAFASAQLKRQAAVNDYVPTTISCPRPAEGVSLIRSADSLSPDEQTYTDARLSKASEALSAWLTKALPGVSTEQLPKLALALSGGGTKAGLTTAGAVYGLDGRESSDSSVAGLLQSMTYISALSGGSLTLSGMMANDFEQVSTLRTELLQKSYQNVFASVITNIAAVRAAVGNKTAAGYPATLVDIYGQGLSYNYISASGGNDLHWSDITSQSSFQDHEAPYPIITITQANVASGMCGPNMQSAIWEVSPFEFGSFDEMVGAFYPTKYMGSTGEGNCTTGFDNTGFITAISSNILLPNDNECYTGNFTADQLNNTLAESINSAVSGVTLINPYGQIPNPFYQSEDAGVIRDQQIIFGTDGGLSGQAVPGFPFLQPERAVDVIFVVDAQTNSPGNVTNGTAIYNTYTSAQQKGLSRMPKVPTDEEFVSQNLSSGAQFYGCHDPEVATVIFLPNTELGIPNELSFAEALLNKTFDGGLAMVTQSQSSGESEWAACLACAIVHKNVTELPDVCTGCLEKYCWPRESKNGSAPAPSPTGGPSPYTGAASGVQSAGMLIGAGAIIALFL
ncbi:unnamed protein product [Zymoseptoria tritici ST99CH_1A5]|uniref:Lysophospholipase n=1 Tax=Zymoseptoria tritici ST99CH_1A5 TaxID=1276529 RepID=A0A1Y6LZZ2_ZYMTR|nr:unnamed protein product [Zymoseptoria tritici ST99CH_1A5]